MEHSKFEREDDINLKDVKGQIEIWQATAIMDGGTIYLHCRYKDKLFRIISKQSTIIGDSQARSFLHLNNTPIKIKSEEEKIILELIKNSLNAADNLWFLPKAIKTLVWSKKKPAYWIEIFKNEILNFVNSNEYNEISKTQQKKD